MKSSDNFIGVVFGLLSWGALFSALIWMSPDSNPPSPSCPYCERQQDHQRQNKKGKPGVLPISPSLEIGAGVLNSEKSDFQAYQAEHNEYHRLKAAFENRGREPNWWQAFIALLAAAIAGVQVWLFTSQLRKMDRSIRDAKDTSKAELRAYVSAEVRVVFHFDATKPLEFGFEAINHGRTPAKDVEFDAVVDIVPNGTTALRKIDSGWNPKRMNLFPNANDTKADRGEIRCNCRRIFTQQEIDQFRAGTHFIFIGLEIQYWDFIENTGYTTRNYYRIEGHPEALRFITRVDGELFEISEEAEARRRLGISLIPGCSRIT